VKSIVTSRFECRDFIASDAQLAIATKIIANAADFQKTLQWQEVRPRVNYQLAVVDCATSSLVGTAGVLMEGYGGGNARFLLNLAQASRGRYAVAFEIGYAMIDWAFDALSVNQLSLELAGIDDLGKRLARYAGFIETDAGWALSYGGWTERREQLEKYGTPNH
jgi:hypothetical protein